MRDRGVDLNVKAVVAALNQEKALVEAFSVIVQLDRLIVYSTSQNCPSLHLWAGTKTTTSGLLMKVTDFLMELEEEVESRLARLVWAGCLI